MASSLKTTRTVSLTRTIPAPCEAVLKALHNPELMIDLAPLVIRKTPTDSDRLTWLITDRLAFGLTTSYTAHFENFEDGVQTRSSAAAGTKLTTRWTATTVPEGTQLVEVTTATAFFFLSPYIESTLKSAHSQMHDRLTDKICGTTLASESSTKPMTTTPTPSSSATPISLALSLWPLALVLFVRLVHPSFTHFPALAVGSGVLSIIIRAAVSASDPYGLYHLSLNKIDGDDQALPPKTEWLNMGFWKDSRSFPQACRALAIKLLETSKYRGGHVLDVGHGTGESLILLLSAPSIPRPTTLTGITSVELHHTRSKGRVDRLSETTLPVNLYHGDAIYRSIAVKHPLDPVSETPPFDFIMALDCAYHFDTRLNFLQQSYNRLAPGGRIALADICFTPAALQNPKTRFLLSLLRMMPKANMCTIETYADDLTQIGYVDVAVEDTTTDVFPGFLRFLKTRGAGWVIFAVCLEAFVDTGAQFVLVSAAKSH